MWLPFAAPTLAAALSLAEPSSVALHPLRSLGFSLDKPGEGVAELEVRCTRCDWGRPGREAAVLRLSIDGRYSQHLVTARGSGIYRAALGPLASGPHRLDIELERRLSCRGVGEVTVDEPRVEAVPDGAPGHEALSRAPFLYLRGDTLKRFTDLPLLLWYEEERSERGRRLRYSVVFSNEDGGTPPDRLMATWGRVTDIEYVYGVDLDEQGRVVREEYQGEDHALLPFRGRHQGAHPLLWITTENNMLAEEGDSTYRVTPAPLPFDLRGVSREAVMDAHPWTYAVSAAEVRREGRVRANAHAGSRRIPDPRRFVHLEACAETHEAELALALGVRRKGRIDWLWSDDVARERDKWRIARNPDHFPNGCFRAAVALPAGAGPRDIAGLRFRSHPRRLREGETSLPPEAGRARLRRVNRLFMLQDDDTPGPSLFSWSGELSMAPAGEPIELPIG